METHNPSAKRKTCPDSLTFADAKRKKAKPNSQHDTSNDKKKKTDNFLSDVTAFILQAGIEKARLKIFKSQVLNFGGHITDDIEDQKCSHVVVDDKMDAERMFRILKLENPLPNVAIVKTTWLSACFKQKILVDASEYCLDLSKCLKQSTYIDVPTMECGGQSSNHDTTDRKQLDKNTMDTTVDGINVIQMKSKLEQSSTENSKVGPKVGTMWQSFKTSKKHEESDDDGDSDYVASDGEGNHEHSDGDGETSGFVSGESSAPNTPHTSPNKMLPVGHWVCAQSSRNVLPNANKHITDMLQEMVKTYESQNDRWRALSYQKAIQSLKKLPSPIRTWEEAKSLPGVGSRLADKIWEIAESGELRKLTQLKSNEEVQSINLFTDVWGAGPTTARTWFQLGFRTLSDLETKANLTRQQRIGLHHYDDFLDRMPREEAGEIQTTVRQTAERLQPGAISVVCGSYRRGARTCGDVDVLVTHPDGKSHRAIFSRLLTELKNTGFLTDDLVTAQETGHQKKYMGVCKLPGQNTKYRRIDIISVPYEEYPCALVYFTGSAHFNRSMRHLAKKMGMSLSEHSLRQGVVRQGGDKVYDGTALPTPSEESVFKQLGIPYRPPEERDH